MNLRPYQLAMVEAIRQRWQAGQRRVLGSLPTGGGKTEVAIDIIRTDATPTTRVLIVVERKTLCHQWVARLRRHGLSHVGILQGDNTIALSAPIIVATAQSIRTRGIPEGVALIIVDESHIWHRAHDKVLAFADGARVLGLTATPLREGLGRRFDCVVTGATIRELIRDGHLVQPRYFAPADDAVDRALADVAIRAGDYALDQLSEAMRTKAIVGDVVATWLRRGESRQTLAFTVDKAHAAELAAEFAAVGVVAEVVVDDTEDDERARIFGAFDRREVRVLVSVGVLSIGFDSPVASCAILARPTMSTSLHIQQGGRVLRPFEGKTDALILDHAGNTLTHGRLEDFVPPDDLSMVMKNTDKKTRRDAANAWVCRGCQSINDLHDDICPSCGLPRRRISAVVVIDGELVPFEGDDVPQAVTLEDVRTAYQMHRWYGASKAMSNPAGWAYHATVRRFKLSRAAAAQALPWSLRDQQPVPPDAECSRWLRAAYQRSRIVARYHEQRSAAHA